MILYPNAKINLGLNVTSRRSDGYHNLSTLFYPIPLCDRLEIEMAEEYSLECSGAVVEGDNIITKVYEAIRLLRDIPPVRAQLTKIIPMGAGLGGGSADAAFMARGLNDLFGLGMSTEQLEELLAPIGADCPFFVKNTPQYAEGIGNIFSPCSLSLKGMYLVVVKPDTFVSTREAYAGITPRAAARPLAEIIAGDMSQWRDALHNDFEDSIFPQHPEIAAIKQRLYDLDACYAAMSGSGAAVFGIFHFRPDISAFADCPFARCYLF